MFHFTLIFLTDYRMFYVLAMGGAPLHCFSTSLLARVKDHSFFFEGGGLIYHCLHLPSVEV